jgi:multiple sugar transport system permease protein
MKRSVLQQVICHVLLIAGLFIVVLPMLYMVSTSLKPNGALYQFPPKFLPSPDEITLENYAYVLGAGKFYINFLNSVFVSVISVVLAALIASALAFVIARFRFPGRRALFMFIVLTMIIPGLTLIVPQYQLAVKLHLINKLSGLIPFYVAWTIPYSTFMIKGFMKLHSHCTKRNGSGIHVHPDNDCGLTASALPSRMGLEMSVLIRDPSQWPPIPSADDAVGNTLFRIFGI